MFLKIQFNLKDIGFEIDIFWQNISIWTIDHVFCVKVIFDHPDKKGIFDKWDLAYYGRKKTT